VDEQTSNKIKRFKVNEETDTSLFEFDFETKNLVIKVDGEYLVNGKLVALKKGDKINWTV